MCIWYSGGTILKKVVWKSDRGTAGTKASASGTTMDKPQALTEWGWRMVSHPSRPRVRGVRKAPPTGSQAEPQLLAIFCTFYTKIFQNLYKKQGMAKQGFALPYSNVVQQLLCCPYWCRCPMIWYKVSVSRLFRQTVELSLPHGTRVGTRGVIL